MDFQCTRIGQKLKSLYCEGVDSLTIWKLFGTVGCIIIFSIAVYYLTNILTFINSIPDKCDEWLKNLDEIDTIGFAFGFSFVLLILISFIKYAINSEWKRKDIGEFLMELPIDTCSIIITVIASLYLNKHIGIGATLIVLTLLLVTLCSMLRRYSIKKGGLESPGVLSLISGLADIIFACIWINYVLNIIKL